MTSRLSLSSSSEQLTGDDDHNGKDSCGDRRAFLATAASSVAAAGLCLIAGNPLPASASVGGLPEFADTDAVLRGLTVRVADKSQQDAMIDFMVEGFGCSVLRKRIKDSVEETWLGYGPEQLTKVPSDFVAPVSSFARYGGHASVHLVYDSRTKAPLYRISDPAPPGDSIAYLQLGVPAYRISKIIKSGGLITDAYGLVSVVSPAGLPVRGVIGIAPDPIMLVAINCVDVSASQAFYRQLGFAERDVPYARPSNGTTIFEPAPPPASVYMSPSQNCMGVLLLPLPKRQKKVTVNPVVESLDIVYSPASGGDQLVVDPVVDPSGVSLSFQSVSKFDAEEKSTR